jgi:pyruvate kinase
VVASTPNDEVRRRLALSRGVIPVIAPYTTGGAGAVINNAVQSALETDAAESGDTVVVLSGMMTELDGVNSSNMLKIHVASETIGSGRSVVSGFVTGGLYWTGDGDLSSVPEGAILRVTESFDGEFMGDTGKLRGIVDAHEGRTSSAAILARELDIPMISGASVSDDIDDGDIVTLDAERGILYEGAIRDRTGETSQ